MLFTLQTIGVFLTGIFVLWLVGLHDPPFNSYDDFFLIVVPYVGNCMAAIWCMAGRRGSLLRFNIIATLFCLGIYLAYTCLPYGNLILFGSYVHIPSVLAVNLTLFIATSIPFQTLRLFGIHLTRNKTGYLMTSPKRPQKKRLRFITTLLCLTTIGLLFILLFTNPNAKGLVRLGYFQSDFLYMTFCFAIDTFLIATIILGFPYRLGIQSLAWGIFFPCVLIQISMLYNAYRWGNILFLATSVFCVWMLLYVLTVQLQGFRLRRLRKTAPTVSE
ncbi:MAG: hypothetical protein PVH19_11265 [Planctomycetia bacterium]|jgi:hypothetical protein